MLLDEFKLQSFVRNFNEELREDTDEDVKFNTLKKELNMHLKKFDKTLKDLPDLKVYVDEYNVLRFSYFETINNSMKIRLLWKINELTEDDIEEYIKEFLTKDLDLEEDELPSLNYVKSNMNQYLALYWPDNYSIVLSKYIANQLPEDDVKSIIRHECIHHYLTVKDMDASDHSEDFVKLIREHDAYVSQDVKALKAYEQFN